MWFEAPEERLYLAQLRQRELHAEAASVRSAHQSAKPPISIEPVHGFHLHLGRLLIVIGRTLREEDACRPHPIHS
jgi:hypothetical protein